MSGATDSDRFKRFQNTRELGAHVRAIFANKELSPREAAYLGMTLAFIADEKIADTYVFGLQNLMMRHGLEAEVPDTIYNTARFCAVSHVQNLDPSVHMVEAPSHAARVPGRAK